MGADPPDAAGAPGEGAGALISRGLALIDELAALYADGEGDPPFTDVSRSFGALDDTHLAELIEADGRLRLRLGRTVELPRYLSAVPDLDGRPQALDAAIDMALRSLAQTRRADEESVQRLLALHPELERPIRDAAALSNAVWSTTNLRDSLGRPEAKKLPCPFGPEMEGGTLRYELIELLGEGAFGQVYLAEDRRLSETGHPALVAIKVIPTAGRSPRMREQLADEATKARRIDHPAVARVLDRGSTAAAEDYLVCEYVDGGDLGRWARHRRGAVTPARAADLLARIARGVHAAHMSGLVHCDLKPNNILMTARGEPKVTDFGIAIRADEQREPSGEGTQPVGNLAFMSPEQYHVEDHALTIPTDVYALGGILYWLVTAALPNGATPEEIRRRHEDPAAARRPPSIRRRRPEVDRDLDAIGRRALAVRPEDRYDSAAALAGDLERWVRREPLPWTRPSLPRRLALWSRRRPAAAAALVLVVLLVIAGAVALQFFLAAGNARRARQNAQETVNAFVAQLKKANAQEIGRQVLVPIWLTEWLYGPTVLGDGPGRLQLWDLRIDVVRDIVERRHEAGRSDDVQTLLWESALGFWLIKRGDHAESEPLLAENAIKWQRRLAPDDPFLAHVQAMHACSVVLALADAEGGPGDTPPRDAGPGALGELETALRRADQLLAQEAPGSPLHRLVLDHLLILEGPQLGDDPERYRALQRRIEALPGD